MKNILFTGIILSIVLASCGDGGRYEAARLDSLRVDSIIMDSIAKAEALAQSIHLNTQTPADKKFIKTAELKFKVRNVLFATEKIEELAVKYGGYMIFSNLQNRTENYRNSRISRDSILISKGIVVENSMQLRVPNARLDSFVRELNPLVVFFDYRVIKMGDVTFQFLGNQKRTERLQTYTQRQKQHIDQKGVKLKETASAEDNLLEHQNRSDDLQIGQLQLQDQLNYCNLNIEIYQKPIIVKEVIADFNYTSGDKEPFFTRILDSIVQGWHILAEVVIFLVKIWGIAVLFLALFFGIQYLVKIYPKSKDKI